LANGTTYYYVVSAVNGGAESGNSAQASATPQVPAPAAPTGLAATGGNTQVALTWNAASGATSYNVKRATTSGGPYSTVTNLTGTSFTDTGLTNGTTYYYVVSALNVGGESANSTQASATPSVPLPSPWATQDIGATGVVGSAGYANGTFTIQGGGANIGGNADAFRFVHQPSSGDCSNTVRVTSVANTGTNAKAGVMIRESSAAGAMEAGVWVTPSSGVVFTSRNGTGSSTSVATASGLTAPYWVRITRTNNKFAAYHSINGTSWTKLGTTKTINMSTNAQIGMGVCSGVSGLLNTATMDNATTTP
jgi:regulation of enolase protein 1 (concanavalin A-like superfamily)